MRKTDWFVESSHKTEIKSRSVHLNQNAIWTIVWEYTAAKIQYMNPARSACLWKIMAQSMGLFTTHSEARAIYNLFCETIIISFTNRHQCFKKTPIQEFSTQNRTHAPPKHCEMPLQKYLILTTVSVNYFL